MANRTDATAIFVHGTDPQNLISKALRDRVYVSRFWKEQCFGLNEALVVDRALDLLYVGGAYGSFQRPTPFLCLLLTLLKIQPAEDIVLELLNQKDHKYVRALAAVYVRFVFSSKTIYEWLEPLYADYRKLRVRTADDGFGLLHMDELIDLLLMQPKCFGIALPRLASRWVLEESQDLAPRVSFLPARDSSSSSPDPESLSSEDSGQG